MATRTEVRRTTRVRSLVLQIVQWPHRMLLMETLDCPIHLCRTEVKIRSVSLPRGEEVVVVENAYFVASFGHFASGCCQKSGCYIEGCGGKHITVIHPPERSLPPRQEIPENHQMINKSNNGANTGNPSNQSHARDNVEHTSQNHAIGAGVRRTCSNASAVGGKVRLRIVPVRVQGKQPGQVVETYALLDNGSDVSLCDEKLIDEVGISCQETFLPNHSGEEGQCQDRLRG